MSGVTSPGIHRLPASLLQGPVTVHLIGCGGTGSQMLTNLSRLHLAMLALGHPGGLHVTVYDPDRVAPSNVGRQLFSRSDIGHNKAQVLINRINCYYGFTWRAESSRYEVVGADLNGPAADIVITCVDTAAARRDIGTALMRLIWKSPIYWLDCGNSVESGQVMLTELRETVVRQTIGSPVDEVYREMGKKHVERRDAVLPPLWVCLPDVFDASIPEDDRPSCSLAESLGDQSLYINSQCATWGAILLERLFREGQLEQHGYWINLIEGVVAVPVPATPADQLIAMFDPKAVTNG